MELEYNYFFYANVCHVCKQFGQGIPLKRCGNCTMIAYCSKAHQKEHWPHHKDLCNAISTVLKDNKMSRFLNDTLNFSMEKWTQIKMNFMLLVAIKLSRKLEHYEEQMFKFLRACAICHNRDSKALVDCPNCPNVSFCAKHKTDKTHEKLCYLFKLCFTADMTTMQCERKISELRIPNFVNSVRLSENMKDFVDYYIKRQLVTDISMEKEIIATEYLTRPLTFLYAVQKLGYILRNDNIVIHIIAANMIEIDSIELWEVLLHWIQNLTVATIVLVGPELSPGSMSVELCKDCRCNNKQLIIQTHGSFYDNYVHSDSYIKANFIIGYNAGIHECEDSKKDTWLQSLQLMSKQNCPLILTSYTLPEAEKEQLRINMILNNGLKSSCCQLNPYSSLRPYRDFETEGIYYQNQYIIIYENFGVQ